MLALPAKSNGLWVKAAILRSDPDPHAYAESCRCRFLLETVLPVRLPTAPGQSGSVTDSSQSLHDKESVESTKTSADPV
jgi:hypothetical protein